MERRALFWSYVDVSGGLDACWPWTAGKDGHGYGRFFDRAYRQSNRLVHRLAYEDVIGPIPEGHDLDHTCHNEDSTCPGGDGCQHRACTNPWHQEPVTRQVNVLRGKTIAAINAAKTTCPAGHSYTGVDNRGARICSVCVSERARAKRAA